MAIATVNPATGQLVKSSEPLTEAHIEAKLKLAVATFPKFRKLSFLERAAMMNKAAGILESDKEEVDGPGSFYRWRRSSVSRISTPRSASPIAGPHGKW